MDAHLCGKVFETNRNRLEHVTNFKTVDGLIEGKEGIAYDPFFLEILKKVSIAGPTEPMSVYLEKSAGVNPDVM